MSKLNVEILKVSSMNDGREMTVYPVLIFDEEKAVLVDTAYPGQFEILKAEIEKHVSIEKLKGIVITHHDIDHVGTVKQFKELLGDNVTIYSTDVEAEFISGEKTPLKIQMLEPNREKLDEGARGFLDFLKGAFPNLFIKVDKTFKAGDRLPIFEEVETLDMPGHTLGHICIYVRDQKTLLTSDAIALENGKLERINDFYNYDIEQAKQSLEKLRDLDINRVLCYHGGEYNGTINVDQLQK